MDIHAQEQAKRVDEDMALAPENPFARVMPRWDPANARLYLPLAGHEAVGEPIDGRESAAPQGE
jgi:hypothetical protein